MNQVPANHSLLSSPALPWFLILGLAAVPTLTAQPGFQYLGDLPGGTQFSSARGVSADGRFVVGESSSTASGVSQREAFIWSAAEGMLGLGDAPGGPFSSTAADVSADGTVIVGSSADGQGGVPEFQVFQVACRWTRGPGGGLQTLGKLGPTSAGSRNSQAHSVSSDGRTVVGNSSWVMEKPTGLLGLAPQRQVGFIWTSAGGMVSLGSFDNQDPIQSTAAAISADGQAIVGQASQSGQPFKVFRKLGTGPLENLGLLGNVQTLPRAVSAGGQVIVGAFYDGLGLSAFRWTQRGQYQELSRTGNAAAGVSASGRVALDGAGGLYLDDRGPFDLRALLAESGVIDLRGLAAASFRAHAISDNGLFVVGSAVVEGTTRAWRARFTDCDANGLPDELEQLAYPDHASSLIAQGSERFAVSRDSLGYGDMIAHYGRPWQPDTDRVPALNEDQPAEFLRALRRVPGCADGGLLASEEAATRFLMGAAFPALREFHAFEMLLGNEAHADSLDPTIGLEGLAPDDLSDQFAFQGVPGIHDLLDEELALLRGRELPGSPADWLDEDIHYPMYTGPEDVHAAVYNRLPPNAVGASGLAYRSNYRVADNYQAASAFPQGHGDAYGHHVSALKAGIDLLRDGPAGWPEEFRPAIAEAVNDFDPALEVVRDLAAAAAARAEDASRITELLFRRDYRENPRDPRAAELFIDPDAERAWSMGEWARRGAQGAFLDWAVVCHWAPADEARSVHRAGLGELAAMAAAVSAFQERLDAAGAGLDPLGLIPNVVPFGIDASGLEPGSGRSHYEQVRDAAARALDNARQAFENANQAGQRLRESDQSFTDFSNQLADTRTDFDQQLIEIFGLPSSNDPQDNDLDPATTDFEESQSHPDLTNFLASDEELAAAGMGPRPAPGQVQIALSELKVAALRVEQAELAVAELEAQIRSQMERLALVLGAQVERATINAQACEEQMALTDRLAQIEERKQNAGMFSSWVKGVIGIASGNPELALDFVGQVVTEFADGLLRDDHELQTEFDIEKERQRIQCWKEAELQGIEDLLEFDAELRELVALVRRTPQLLVDVSVATELANQALGRLRQAVERGRLIARQKRQLETRIEGDLLEERWRDLSFRVYRNAALKNYRAFFDLAARYVVLAARAYAYEFDARSDGDDVLAGIYRERRLGSAAGLGGGLQGVLTRLDGSITANNFNRPLESLGERSFSFRRNLMGIGIADFPGDDLRFRAWLESHIVERLEDLGEIRDLAQISAQRDHGPAVVIPFLSEIDGRNFFGHGPDLPYGNANFSITRNAKIRSYAVRFDGVDTSLGIDPESGTVFVYLLPAGDSVLRENTNLPLIEDELAAPWAVVDQYLPTPPLAAAADFAKRAYNPWRATAQSGGNFLNEIKRQRDSEAQVELGQGLRFNTNLAGRSAWNTRWLLVVPGGQWTSSSDPAAIRRKLLQFIYGPDADPGRHAGITDIRVIIQAYSH